MGQGGNIFFALFGAVGMVGALGVSTATLIRGPVTGMARVTDYTIAKTDMQAAAILLSEATLARPDADCDSDGMIEPPPPRTVNGNIPAGGGLLPAGTSAALRDPWRGEYGYCAWDHGFWTIDHDIAACGGALSGRRRGTNADIHPAIALISAGPNGIFETSCHDYDGDGQTLVMYGEGSDDFVRLVPYGQFMMPSSAQARLGELPDGACMPSSVGLMRFKLGVMQLCTESGWIEMSPASGGDIHFEPVVNAALGAAYTSNSVAFGTLSAPLAASVSGGATMSINGGPPVTEGTINANDTLSLSGIAPALPEAAQIYTVLLGSVTKTWSITTRDAYIGKLSITPIQSGAMNVTGPGNPAHGATIGFIISNTGERTVGPLYPAMLSNTTNFAFDIAGGHVGDDCAGKILRGSMSGSESCIIDVRPQADADMSYNGVLTVGDGDVTVSASLAGTAAGWGCNAPWGAYVANGTQVTAYREKCNLLGCAAQTRHCTDGALSGTYEYATCSTLLGCIQ